MIPKYWYLQMRWGGCSHADVMQFAETVEKYEMFATESDWSLFKDLYYKGGVEFLEEVLKDIQEKGLMPLGSPERGAPQ